MIIERGTLHQQITGLPDFLEKSDLRLFFDRLLDDTADGGTELRCDEPRVAVPMSSSK